MTTEDTNTNTPSADEIREAIRAEMTAEVERNKAAIDELVADAIAAAPEHLRKLIPESLPPVEQARWLRKASKESGAFAPAVPATDTRKPNNNPQPEDTAALSPIARIAAGYSKN